MKYFLHHDDLPKEVCIGSSIAIDTETTGLNLVRDRLCLIQICTERKEIHLIKITKNSNSPVILNILCNNKILKIFHFARFDLAVLMRDISPVLGPIYCTKIASKLARTYSDRHGLKELCSELLSIELSKQQQSTDWGSEVLSEAQKSYAASDVLFLHRLKIKLSEQLRREGRLEIAHHCFDFLAHRVALDLAGFEDLDIFHH